MSSKRRVLLDECLPRPMRRDRAIFEVETVQGAGFAGLQNGALIAAINGRFDVLVTVDSSMRFQQNLSAIQFGIIVLSVLLSAAAAGREHRPK